jgi:hypothetical protein
MGLIDVPKSKEEIAAYLADGQTRSAPFVANADVNDGDILGQTNTIDLGGGSYKFSITLPSGRNLESAPVGPEYPKRDATFQWLDAVRSSIVGDAEQAAEETYAAARQREPIEAPKDAYDPTERVRPATTSGPVPSDPVDYANHQLRGALERMAQLADAEQQVERWQRVVNSLTGDNVPTGTKKKRRKKRASIKNAAQGGIKKVS